MLICRAVLRVFLLSLMDVFLYVFLKVSVAAYAFLDAEWGSVKKMSFLIFENVNSSFF